MRASLDDGICDTGRALFANSQFDTISAHAADCRYDQPGTRDRGGPAFAAMMLAGFAAALLLAHAVNAIFKSGVAQTSHQPGFYLRLMAGFVIMFAVGAVAIVTVDPARVIEVVNQLHTN